MGSPLNDWGGISTKQPTPIPTTTDGCHEMPKDNNFQRFQEAAIDPSEIKKQQ